VDRVRETTTLLETLFIFGTNKSAIETIVKELKAEKNTHSEIIALERNPDVTMAPLLVPKYKLAAESTFRDIKRRVQEIRPMEFRMLDDYLKFVENDQVLLLRHRSSPKSVAQIREAVANSSWHFSRTENAVAYGSLDLLWSKVTNYYGIVPSDFHELAVLTDEIDHYNRILVEMTEIAQVERLKEKIKKVTAFKDVAKTEAELDQLLDTGQIDREEYKQRIKFLATSTADQDQFQYMADTLTIKRIARHYYIPTIISHQEKVSFINHIIKVPSEREFLEKVSNYVADANNRLGEFDDWAFSKVDESVDKVFIPYIDAFQNKTADFFPDFVFWFKKGKEYKIVFVDPKGTQQRGSYDHKVRGYKQLFFDNSKPRKLSYDDLSVTVWLFLYNRDARLIEEDIWIDDFSQIVDSIL
jgi:hypothetical protein